jgi:Mor family transcriptional regulator
MTARPPPFALQPSPRSPDPAPAPGRRLSRAAAAGVRRVGKVPLDMARWPSTFVGAVEVAAAALAELPADATDEQRAMATVTAIAHWLGPGAHYWPSAQAIKVAARDWLIYNKEFDGRNTRLLASRYHMTVRGMTKLLKRQREHQIAARRARKGNPPAP